MKNWQRWLGCFLFLLLLDLNTGAGYVLFANSAKPQDSVVMKGVVNTPYISHGESNVAPEPHEIRLIARVAAPEPQAGQGPTFQPNGTPQTVSPVVLSWNAGICAAGTTCDSTTGYWLYRANASGQEQGAPLNSTIITGTTYTDSNVVAGGTYYYKVAAAGTANNVSGPSNEATATVPQSQPNPPNPTGCKASA